MRTSMKLALVLCGVVVVAFLWVGTSRPTLEEAVLVGAGDIANCNRDTDEATARLLATIPGTVFTTGDNAYEEGTLQQYQECYGPNWGQYKDRTRPAPGNHEYMTTDGSGYYTYFGDAAGLRGKGYYSYDLAGWHIVVLNSSVDAGPESEQAQWLQQDLAAHPADCTLAYWHYPVFSSGDHGNNPKMQPMWEILYRYGADLVINGHDHNYERFAPQTPAGQKDLVSGIRQFVVGTGGAGLREIGEPQPNSVVRDSATHGVLKLTLHRGAYSWEFMAVEGETFRDNGVAPCIAPQSAADR
jgi:acid phosphatase type 7